MKKLLVSSLIALTAPLALISPAAAAVPSKPATQIIPCPGDETGEARVWTRSTKGRLTKLAIDNPCGWYLGFASGATMMFVAPGSHFNWGPGRIRRAEKAGLPLVPGGKPSWTDALVCDGDTVTLIIRYDDARLAC